VAQVRKFKTTPLADPQGRRGRPKGGGPAKGGEGHCGQGSVQNPRVFLAGFFFGGALKVFVRTPRMGARRTQNLCPTSIPLLKPPGHAGEGAPPRRGFRVAARAFFGQWACPGKTGHGSASGPKQRATLVTMVLPQAGKGPKTVVRLRVPAGLGFGAFPHLGKLRANERAFFLWFWPKQKFGLQKEFGRESRGTQ